MTSLRRQLFAVLFLATGLASCSTVQTTQSPDYDFRDVRSYAWRAEPSTAMSARSDDDPWLLARLKHATEREFSRHGVRQAPQDEASIWVEATLEVSTAQQNNDPYYSLHVAERYEEGWIVIEFYDPATQELLWRGELAHRIRYTERSFGGLAPEFHPVAEPRNWLIEEIVERVMQAAADGRRSSSEKRSRSRRMAMAPGLGSESAC